MGRFLFSLAREFWILSPLPIRPLLLSFDLNAASQFEDPRLIERWRSEAVGNACVAREEKHGDSEMTKGGRAIKKACRFVASNRADPGD